MNSSARYLAKLIARRFVGLLLIVSTGATAAGYIHLPWPLALLENFRPQLFVGVLLLSAMLLMLRAPKMASIGLLLAVSNYVPFAKTPITAPDATVNTGIKLTVVWANVHNNQAALSEVLAYGREQAADLVLISEFPRRLRLDRLSVEDYPNRFDVFDSPSTPRHVDRIVALSRLPIQDKEVLPESPGRNRVFLDFSVTAPGGQPLNVIAAHPNAPLSTEWHTLNQEHLSWIAEAVEPPFLLAGDLNATPWSRSFGQIPGHALGHSKWAVTWRNDSPEWVPDVFVGLLIDHFIVSDGLQASRFEIGPRIQSNHRPILTTLVLPRS